MSKKQFKEKRQQHSRYIIMKSLLTVKETASILKTNVDYVYKLIRLGLLPSVKLGQYKIREETLEDFLARYEGYDLTSPESIKEICNGSGKCPRS